MLDNTCLKSSNDFEQAYVFNTKLLDVFRAVFIECRKTKTKASVKCGKTRAQQVMVSFGYTSDWLSKWREIS